MTDNFNSRDGSASKNISEKFCAMLQQFQNYFCKRWNFSPDADNVVSIFTGNAVDGVIKNLIM